MKATQPTISVLRAFGIETKLAGFVILADLLLFSGEIASWFSSLLYISIPAGIFITILGYIRQKRIYGDSRPLAFFKAFGLGVITAIPTPIASILTVIGATLPFLAPKALEEGNEPMKKAKGRTIDKDDQSS